MFNDNRNRGNNGGNGSQSGRGTGEWNGRGYGIDFEKMYITSRYDQEEGRKPWERSYNTHKMDVEFDWAKQKEEEKRGHGSRDRFNGHLEKQQSDDSHGLSYNRHDRHRRDATPDRGHHHGSNGGHHRDENYEKRNNKQDDYDHAQRHNDRRRNEDRTYHQHGRDRRDTTPDRGHFNGGNRGYGRDNEHQGYYENGRHNEHGRRDNEDRRNHQHGRDRRDTTPVRGNFNGPNRGYDRDGHYHEHGQRHNEPVERHYQQGRDRDITPNRGHFNGGNRGYEQDNEHQGNYENGRHNGRRHNEHGRRYNEDRRNQQQYGHARDPYRVIKPRGHVNRKCTYTCVFCFSLHKPDHCPEVVDVVEREAFLTKARLCTRCLGGKCGKVCSKPRIPCSYCFDTMGHKPHHYSLCPLPRLVYEEQSEPAQAEQNPLVVQSVDKAKDEANMKDKELLEADDALTSWSSESEYAEFIQADIPSSLEVSEDESEEPIADSKEESMDTFAPSNVAKQVKFFDELIEKRLAGYQEKKRSNTKDEVEKKEHKKHESGQLY